MLIQIYEISTADEAAALCAAGVDHVGVLVGDGAFPREQSIAAARKIFEGVRPPSRRCALSLSPDLSHLHRIVEVLAPDILHLGCAPDLLGPAQVPTLRQAFPAIAIMRSIPVADAASIDLARSYDRVSDFLLLDSYSAGDKQIGALGVTHDWELDRRIVESVNIPVIIAGGLGPENVCEAMTASRPAGVDSKTLTDRSDGSHTKDLARVRAFVEAVRGCSGASESR